MPHFLLATSRFPRPTVPPSGYWNTPLFPSESSPTPLPVCGSPPKRGRQWHREAGTYLLSGSRGQLLLGPARLPSPPNPEPASGNFSRRRSLRSLRRRQPFLPGCPLSVRQRLPRLGPVSDLLPRRRPHELKTNFRNDLSSQWLLTEGQWETVDASRMAPKTFPNETPFPTINLQPSL